MQKTAAAHRKRRHFYFGEENTETANAAGSARFLGLPDRPFYGHLAGTFEAVRVVGAIEKDFWKVLTNQRVKQWGHVAEWLRNGLQNRVLRFNSGRGLHFIYQ